jgi:hypothetical protein
MMKVLILKKLIYKLLCFSKDATIVFSIFAIFHYSFDEITPSKSELLLQLLEGRKLLVVAFP